MPDFYFILFLMRLDADEKLQYFQLPYIPCMVSGNEIKLCLKYFCLPIYFVHFEPRPKPSDGLKRKKNLCKFLSKRVFVFVFVCR
jgi:hypothetical protein